MNYRFIGAALTAGLMLSACATNPIVTATPAEVREKILHARVTVLPIDRPAALTERTKAQAVGNFVISSVLSSAAGSGGHATSPQQFQAQARIAQDFGNELSKALPTSYSVASGHGADLALAKKVSDFFNKREPASDPAGQEISIAVSAPLWELGYLSFLGSADYALSYRLLVSVWEQSVDKPRSLKTIDCTATAEEKMPLEQWQANDYAALNTNAERIVDTCFKRFLTETGLSDQAGS